MGLMPQLNGFYGMGDKAKHSGAYACANCGEVIYLKKGESLPKCKKCKDFVYWYAV